MSGLDLYLAITPSNIERTAASHNIGYVSLINKQGISVSSQQSIDVYLSSSNKEIATVPEKVTIESGSKFKQFPVVTSGKRGDVIITATFGKLSSSSKLAVGIIRDDLLPGTSLEIRIPSKEMLINTEMPFSIYLKTPDGKIQRALKDITLDLSYDDNLITTESHTITIKEGDNYAWGILSSKGVSGKGYLQAKNAELDLDSATHVNVSSNFGTKIDVDVFPKVVTSGNDRQIDIFVSIIDDAGNPTVASEDVYLTLFSNRDFIGTQLEKITKDEKPMIKKGQFGYHLSHKFDLLKTLDNFIEIGANAKNYGVKYDYFSIAGTTYTTDSDKFTDAQVKISSLYGDVKFDEDTGFGYDFEVVLFGPKSIPPGVESIVGIETAVLEVDVDDKDLVDCTVDVINATGAVVDQTQTQCPNPNF